MKEIGIITPYRKQEEKLRGVINTTFQNGNEILIGSVEKFQGLERRVIIISAVRSSKDHIGKDASHNLGFLKNPKRFNVAVSRAQALLIVVGNPKILILDKHWGSLYEYCKKNGAYIGPEVGNPVDDFLNKFDSFNLDEEHVDDVDWKLDDQ